MSDREKAISILSEIRSGYSCFDSERPYYHALSEGIKALSQPERRFDEWCTDCKEYDQEKHCCPRFNHVIRTTLQEVQPERNEIIQKFRDYQIEWLTAHCDLELEPELETWVVRFLCDTADCFEMEVEHETD